MTFKFNITKQDYYKVRAHEFAAQKSFRRLVLFERVMGLVLIGFCAFALRDYVKHPVAFVLVLLIAALWVIGFPKIMTLRFKSHAKKEFEESGERIRDGEVVLTFGEHVIEQVAPGRVIRRVSYKRIVWVENTKDYVTIYDDYNPTPIIIPSNQIFESKEEQAKFVKDLRDDCNITVESRFKALGKGPRLKVHKKN